MDVEDSAVFRVRPVFDRRWLLPRDLPNGQLVVILGLSHSI